MLKWKAAPLSVHLHVLRRAAGRDRHEPPAVRRRRGRGAARRHGLRAEGRSPGQAAPHRRALPCRAADPGSTPWT
jgi:hypothetical protein